MAQPHHCIPFHVKNQIEEKLRQRESDGIIERADDPTPWLLPERWTIQTLVIVVDD